MLPLARKLYCVSFGGNRIQDIKGSRLNIPAWAAGVLVFSLFSHAEIKKAPKKGGQSNIETSGRIEFSDAQNSGGIKTCNMVVSPEPVPAKPRLGFQRPKEHQDYPVALSA